MVTWSNTVVMSGVMMKAGRDDALVVSKNKLNKCREYSLCDKVPAGCSWQDLY